MGMNEADAQEACDAALAIIDRLLRRVAEAPGARERVGQVLRGLAGMAEEEDPGPSGPLAPTSPSG